MTVWTTNCIFSNSSKQSTKALTSELAEAAIALSESLLLLYFPYIKDFWVLQSLRGSLSEIRPDLTRTRKEAQQRNIKMEKAASASLKQCLRSGKTLRCRIAFSSSSAGCIATAICPARIAAHTSPTNPSSASRVRDHVRLSMPKRTLRGYSTHESSIAGTIGKGAAGIPSEAEHTFEALVAPEHLNEKERAVWELLSQELKPQRLEVQDISGGCGSMYGIEIR